MSMTPTEILLDELRHARVARELTQEDFGKLINYSGTHVSAVETGARPPTADYLAVIDRALGTGGMYARLLSRLSALDMAPPWLREWIKLESQAKSIRWYEPAYVPGLLQTETYARTMLEAGGLLDERQIEQRVRSRLDRQLILSREAPPYCVFVLDEAVLRRTANNERELMVEQLDHLLTVAARPHVEILVVPAETGLYPGLVGGFIQATLPDGVVVAHVDQQVHSQSVGDPAKIAILHTKWEAIVRVALPPRQSLDLIKEVAKTWT